MITHADYTFDPHAKYRKRGLPHTPDDPEADYAGRTRDTHRYIKHRYPDLAPDDARWVELESARFVATNTDTLDDNHELATRAHDYAAMKTSTFTPTRSAAICERFVARVATLGRQAYRPAVVRTAAYQDFDDQAIYLC